MSFQIQTQTQISMCPMSSGLEFFIFGRITVICNYRGYPPWHFFCQGFLLGFQCPDLANFPAEILEVRGPLPWCDNVTM